VDRADLELVVAVGRTGSLTAAARHLHVAQPALSRRLAALERGLGAALFQRGRHGATPTVVGRALIEGASSALSAIERAEQDANDAAAGRAGRLRVGVIPTLGAVLLPPVLAAFRASHPGVRLELVSRGSSAELRQRVGLGELDIAIAVLAAGSEPGVRVAARGQQRFVVVAPADTPLRARNGKVDRRQLLGVPVVALVEGEGLRQQLDSVYADLGAEPNIAFETSEREMLLPMVAAGLGITLVPAGFASQRAAAGFRVNELSPALDRTVGAVVAPKTGVLVDAFVAALVKSGELRAVGVTGRAAQRRRSPAPGP
jgi:DNA-binding transcriptional LysR family regulator